MRLMEMIRRKGNTLLKGFLIIFLISVFAGLGVGFFGRAQQAKQGPGPESHKVNTLDNTGKLANAVMLVNGQPVSEREYSEVLAGMLDRIGASNDDPWNIMYAYGYIIRQFTMEEVILGKAKELGVTVTSADLEKSKADAIATLLEKTEKKSGNVLGDMGGRFKDMKARKAAFTEYLDRMQMTESQWETRAKRELMLDNTRKKLQDEADAKKKAAAEEIKKKIDDRLAKGEKFADLAKEYSDDATAAQGGDIGTWVGRGLMFDEATSDKVFATKVGEMTEWFDIPAGLQRFLIYEKREATGPAFEAEKPKLAEQVKNEKGKDYKPTDADLKKAYEAVKFRQILLRVTDDGAADKAIQDLVEAAKVEINHPDLLAYQAIMGDKLELPASISYDKLVQIAKNSAAAPDYDFTLIKTKLPTAEEKAAATSPAEGAVAKPGTPAAETETPATPADANATTAPAAGEDGQAATPPADAPADEAAPAKRIDMTPPGAAADAPPAQPVPLYALTIGLFTQSLQDAGANAGSLPYFFIAKTYMDWLDDDKQLAKQTIDRDKARAKIAECLAKFVEMQNYNALGYAYQGLNLARMNKPEEAKPALDNAQKYAPQKPGAVWEVLVKAYKVLGDEGKVKQIQDLSDKLRQEQLQQQLQQQMQQQGGGQSMPIQIPAQ